MRKLITALLMSMLMMPTSAVASSGGPGTGWVRLAHLCPDTPVVDVYLYNFGDPHAFKVLRGVGLGVISPYMALPAGEYTIAIRETATDTPVVSTAVWVDSGMMYTVAGIGESRRTRLAVLDDSFTASPAHAIVRVLSASLAERRVSVSVGGTPVGRGLRFGQLSSYTSVTPGPSRVMISGHNAQSLTLDADSVHTLIVIDTSAGPRITDLLDAVGVSAVPSGGAATGLGGTASGSAPSPLPWLAMIAAGLALSANGLRRRRAR
jgi:hypothetical protein